MKWLALFALLAVLAPLPASARCLRYEPAIVTLQGKLSARVVPGPPGYVSIARGDMPETIYVLELDETICVLSESDSYYNTRSYPTVEEVQLEVSPVDAKQHVGKRIRATGSLFGAHTGHHRTPVVLRVHTVVER